MDAYEEGFESYPADSWLHNPYVDGSEQYSDWLAGWSAAAYGSSVEPDSQY